MARPGEEGKLDASGTSHSGNANVAETYNQVSEQPSLARVRALTANLARRPTLLTHAPCLLSGQAIRGVQKTSDIRAGDSRNRHRNAIYFRR
jgi:hypothetical protein